MYDDDEVETEKQLEENEGGLAFIGMICLSGMLPAIAGGSKGSESEQLPVIPFAWCERHGIYNYIYLSNY